MKRLRRILASALVLPAIATHVAASESGDLRAKAQFAVGVEPRVFADEGRRNWQGTGPRPVTAIVWYPASASSKSATAADPNEHFVSLNATPQAPLSSAAPKYPLLLLSHGASGQARALQWFGHYFAERGYIVASVNHHGDTTTESERPPQGRMHFWERPGDLSVALTSLLMDAKLGSYIDRDRIGAAGYSAGGGTVIQLAGAIFKPSELDSLCKANPAKPGCDIPPMVQEQLTRIDELAKVDSIVRASIDRRDHSFKDERIKGAFVIAPALGRLFTEAGLSTVNIPIAIVASRADKVTPLDIDAQPYARSIPSATLTEVPGDVSHFAFGNECTLAGKRTLSICKDADGVDRAELHRWVGTLAYQFFEGIWNAAAL